MSLRGLILLLIYIDAINYLHCLVKVSVLRLLIGRKGIR